MKKAMMLMFALVIGLSFATMTFADEKKTETTKTEKSKTEKKDGSKTETKSETKTESKSEKK